MAKKFLCLSAALLLICLLTACGSRLIDTDSVTAIEIVPAGGDAVLITDSTIIKGICDNLNSLKLKRMEYNEPTVLLYNLRFCAEDGTIVENLRISIDGWLDINGYFHYVSRGALNLTPIEEVIG